MKDYSQHGEQQIITDYFGDFKGNLLDIGANDGITFSNSLALINAGWAGDLVEPSFEAFYRLCKIHLANERVYLHNVAISAKTGTAKFYESGALLNGEDHALVSSLKKSETKRWRKATNPEHHVVEYTETKVPIVTWEKFMQHSHCKTFDFITMDVEGMELEILRQMDLVELGCKLICIEYNGRDYQEYDRLIPMPIIYKNKTNLIYAVKK